MKQHLLLEELSLATRILAHEGVIDGFGHVSIRDGDHYFMCLDNSGREFIELDSKSDPVRADGPRPSIERFIHGEIYRARPDVNAVVHTHSPTLIPFGVSQTPLRPLYHMCGFLGLGAPIFDIESEHGMTDMLVSNSSIGQSLAGSLGESAIVLMRGHGATIVGGSVRDAVYRAIYASINAALQPVAMQLGSPKYLASEEAYKADELHRAVVNRAWDHWVRSIR